MNNDEIIRNVETGIDNAYSTNKLKDVGYTQAVWTLLSVAEDHYLKVTEIKPLNKYRLHGYIDGLINWLSYPLRVCLKEADIGKNKLIKELIEEHYQLALDWINISKVYSNFCAIFPLWHKKKIKISIDGMQILTTDLSSISLEYEAYNKLLSKSGDGAKKIIYPEPVYQEIVTNTTFRETTFNVNFNPKLASNLMACCNNSFSSRYNLPGNWQFSEFNLSQFKTIFITTQALLFAWMIARSEAVRKNIQDLGYSSSVWVVEKKELVNRIHRYSKQPKKIIQSIYELITFGNAGIRDPDIALQPLVDLKNGFYALSPFIWLNVDAERNLCVLLNKITSEQIIYSRLVKEKESIQRKKFEDISKSLGFDNKHGNIGNTDLDLAIIDRNNKACIALQLKWFIEPTEIREIHDRTEDISKGVEQALMVKEAFDSNNTRLIREILGIDSYYRFISIVATENWIGHFDVQNSEVPIIKIGHLTNKLKSSKNLIEVISWLNSRSYLPKKGEDFNINYSDIELGGWKSKWYGIEPVQGNND
jgi:hypothetical protein